ncbi:MAG: ADP-ribosylglycohydrolase family protein, partial [bacterium]
AIIGDISGSRFEWRNHKSKDFVLLDTACRPTDDSNMTLAVANAILRCKGWWGWRTLPKAAIRSMQTLGRLYPFGYGPSFKRWLNTPNPQPYGSWGNGAAMRVSPCGWAAQSMEEALRLSDAVTAVSHDHPEGLRGARAVTAAIYLALHGANKAEIRAHTVQNYYILDFTLDGIRPYYNFDVSCQGSVPQAIEAFLEADGYEDTVRNAISLGGDSDTIAAIAGSIAEAYYGIPLDLREQALKYLDETQTGIIAAFEQKYGRRDSE